MKNSKDIRWGILGCGDVCEVKSGPAFNRVEHSQLVAVMRRDGEKARDFARRHHVPKYYSEAADLIADDDINAIYIATPPAFHEEYALQAMEAGKSVYIEKPVALSGASCERMLKASRDLGVKASVAHYRRKLPLFEEIRSLLQSGDIGQPTLILVNTLLAQAEKTTKPGYWRTDPEISGGGLFFDLAPHQLDIFYWLFGKPTHTTGFSMNQKNTYAAPDLTNLEAVYAKDIYLHGLWAFNIHPSFEKESCEIIGDQGRITFSFFNMGGIEIATSKGTKTITVDYPENIQHPMIDAVVKFFRDEASNPCSLDDALATIRMMEATN